MSLVSNYIGAIPSNFGTQEAAKPEFDLGDKTFADLLDKQMNVQNPEQESLLLNMGQPAGFTENGTNLVDLISSIKNTQAIEPIQEINENDIGTSEMVAFLTRPFDSMSALEHNNSLMDFAKRQASNFYNKCASNVVTDIKEFVEDTLRR